MKRFFLLGILIIFLVYVAPLGFQFYQNNQAAEETIHTVKNVEITQEPHASDGQNAENTAQEESSGGEKSAQSTMLTVSVGGTVREMELED